MTAVEIITAREVPLGGPRAMTVHRTLPQRQRSLIGAWCFVDHYGPDDVSATGGMDVAPHPHTGLQTVSWLFEGTITHHDSADNHAVVRPTEVNLMTAGSGICHSEVSTQETTVLHGVQLWVALPDGRRNGPQEFEHFVPQPVELTSDTGESAGTGWVFVGDLLDQHSPVRVYTPLVGAELRLKPGATITVEVNPDFEHGILVDSGSLTLSGTPVARRELAYTGIGETELVLTADPAEETRLIFLGGEPFGEQITMFWNFIGRSTEEIRQFRADWQDQNERFGHVEGYISHDPKGLTWLPSPELPNIHLKPRVNPEPVARPEKRIDV